ncbi:MAG: iron-containing alcohol dehydrogenase [Eubacterium sp.]|nr:iron-containing alcohol dehydrogenase [Eubacterium sp.]
MRFYAPTNVFVEKDCVKNHAKELTALGTSALILTGRHSALANGSLADVTAVLDQASIPYVVFNEVEENPSVQTVVRAAELGKKAGADFVIGIGGGSPLDAGKAAAILLANPDETGDCLYAGKDLKPAPYAAVPTTCGTGAEVTPNAVLTRPELMKKGSMSYNVYPQIALVDGKYIAGAGRKLIVNTAVDALAHLVESRLHSKANLYNHMFSEYGLQLWSGLIPFLEGEQEGDEEVYSRCMLTATVAGMAIAQTGTSLPHALSYPLTLTYNVPHGRACGLLLAAYMEALAANDPEPVKKVLSLLGLEDVAAFDGMIRRLLGEEVVSEAFLVKTADDMAVNPGKLKTFPYAIDREGIEQILRKSLKVEDK